MVHFLLDLSVANSSSVRGRALGSCFFVLTQLLICPALASPRASICSCSEFMIVMSLSYPDGGISWPFYPSSDSYTLSTTPSSGFLGPESRWYKCFYWGWDLICLIFPRIFYSHKQNYLLKRGVSLITAKSISINIYLLILWLLLILIYLYHTLLHSWNLSSSIYPRAFAQVFLVLRKLFGDSGNWPIGYSWKHLPWYSNIL